MATEIANQAELTTWLKTQSHEVCIAVASRAALRTIPIMASEYAYPESIDRNRRNTALLSAIHATLIAGIEAKSPNQFNHSDIGITIADTAVNLGQETFYTSSAVDVAFAIANIFSFPAGKDAAHETIKSARTAIASFVSAPIDDMPDAALTSNFAYTSFDQATYTDSTLARALMLDAPLWHSQNAFLDLNDVPLISGNIFERHHIWSFWRDWYQGFLDGKPLDWELQRRVALIPDEDWEKGPEHIARLIEEIRAQFELEKRIEELEAEKQVWQERARLGIGGNNPPEALEDDRIVQEIIWAPIEELKTETQSDVPDKARIKSAISKLGAALIAIGKWPLGKLDKAADEFAKALGKWGGGACAGWLALNSDKIAEIIKAAQNWLGTLF